LNYEPRRFGGVAKFTLWNSKAKFVKKTFLISKGSACLSAAGRGLGFEIKKVFEQIYSIGPGKSVPSKRRGE